MGFFRKFVAVLALMLCASYAQAEAMVGYKILNQPQPVASGKKIEVLEFFSYGCSHCYNLHPLLVKWEKRMPKDVELQYVPVVFDASQAPMAHTFYALESMGQIKRLHDPLFVAWNVKGIDLSDEEKITEFVAKYGVDRSNFSAEYNSFSVSSRVARSNQWVLSYAIRGTPTMIVDGKYVITNLHPEDAIRVLDEAIKTARKERSKR